MPLLAPGHLGQLFSSSLPAPACPQLDAVFISPSAGAGKHWESGEALGELQMIAVLPAAEARRGQRARFPQVLGTPRRYIGSGTGRCSSRRPAARLHKVLGGHRCLAVPGSFGRRCGVLPRRKPPGLSSFALLCPPGDVGFCPHISFYFLQGKPRHQRCQQEPRVTPPFPCSNVIPKEPNAEPCSSVPGCDGHHGKAALLPLASPRSLARLHCQMPKCRRPCSRPPLS